MSVPFIVTVPFVAFESIARVRVVSSTSARLNVNDWALSSFVEESTIYRDSWSMCPCTLVIFRSKLLVSINSPSVTFTSIVTTTPFALK